MLVTYLKIGRPAYFMLNHTSVLLGGLEVMLLWEEGKRGEKPRDSSLDFPGWDHWAVCAPWLLRNCDPPTCASQWGLCSKLVEECMSQVVVGVQFSSTVLQIGLIFKGIQMVTFSSERSESRKSILPCYWRNYPKTLCVICPSWLEVDRDVWEFAESLEIELLHLLWS